MKEARSLTQTLRVEWRRRPEAGGLAIAFLIAPVLACLGHVLVMSEEVGKEMTDRLQGTLSRDKKEGGEALVEFVILAPILIFLLLAIVDFGRIFDAWVVATNAAREGARYASIYAGKDYITSAQVEQMSKQKAYDYLTSGLGLRSDVAYSLDDITVSMPSKQPGQPVTVSVSVRVQIWALLNLFPSNQATIQGQATMRI